MIPSSKRGEAGNRRPDRRDVRCFDAAAAGGLALTLAAKVETPGAIPLLGDTIDPLEFLPVALIGGIALRSLRRRGLVTEEPRWIQGVASATAGATVLAGVAIAVDTFRPFGRGINVVWPGAFATYPVVAVMAESLLHLVPVAVLSAVAGGSTSRLAASVIAPVAALEAVFQVVASPVNRWFLGPHLFVVGVYQLRLLDRHGFASMLSFRLVYYLWWHVLWGRLRLETLL